MLDWLMGSSTTSPGLSFLAQTVKPEDQQLTLEKVIQLALIPHYLNAGLVIEKINYDPIVNPIPSTTFADAVIRDSHVLGVLRKVGVQLRA